MPDPKKPGAGLFEEEDDKTQAVPAPAFGDDDGEQTELVKPGELPFVPRGLADEDDEATRIAPGGPPKKK